MDPDRWTRLESLCDAALERPARDRAAYLLDLCASDPGLLADARALVAQLECDPGFLERPILALSDPAGDEGDVTPPATIGSYRVVRRLGRGGMGEVYLAWQRADDVRRLVAVKVIRQGRDTDDVLRRFRLERRILAGLDHPHIARLLDAGATPDARPYFVMEYVAGVPVDQFCRMHALAVDRRLDLFVLVAGAVQHAHQNLVVHRDLKPTNILVTDQGVPKLLDFGIGKVLNDSAGFGTAVETTAHRTPLTPAYAAPEQIRGEPVTAATDVYALGLLLYELLAGCHPYLKGGESLEGIEQAVLSTPPPGPSVVVRTGELRRRLAGDLDNIVLKALRKEPERRYASAAALADDVRRHLDGLPVSARSDTFGYRARKFVRRNAAWVVAALMAFAALGTTTAVTLVQSRRVSRESALAALERDKALEVRGFLMEMFGATGADHAVGDSVTARRLLDIQAAGVDSAYRDRPDLQAEMLDVLADGYDRLGLSAQAEPLARRALALRRETVGTGHPETGSSLTLLGWIQHELGRTAEAEPLLREAIAVRRAGGPRFTRDLARSLNDLGVVLNSLERPVEAESVLVEALALRRAAFGDGHRSVGVTASNLAAAFYFQSKVTEAIRIQEVAVEALLQAVGPDHQRSIVALGNLAAYRQWAEDWEGAEREYRVLLERQTRIRGPDHPMTAMFMRYLARVLSRQKEGPRGAEALWEAETLLRDALAIAEPRLGAAHPQVKGTRDDLAMIIAARTERRR